MPIQFSEKQQTTIASALTLLSVLVIVCTVGLLGLLLGLFVDRFSNVFLPLAVAGVAALVFQPYYRWLTARLRFAPLALLAVFLSVILPLGAFIWFFGALVAGQIADLVEKAPAWWEHLTSQAQQRWPQVLTFLRENPLGQRLQHAVEGQGESLVEGLQLFGAKAWSAGAVVLRGIAGAFSWAVTPIYFIFFLMAGTKPFETLEDFLPFFKPDTRKDVVYLAREFVNIVVAFFRGQLVIAFLQGLLFAVGFTLVGLSYGFVLGLVLGFLNIIPYLGNIVGLGIALPLAFFQDGGGLATVAWVLLVFTAVQSIEAYLLTPRIMGDRTGLHPMVIIVAIFFWGSALNGILGLILAIPLTAFLVVFWRLVREKYIEEWV